ncbi:Uncharacterised protein [Vibrio cholerae]|nr:Uncharacterised protein [Vibrio cholerae]
MIFHITCAPAFAMFTGKLIKQILRFFTQNVDQHVQATAVRHPNHHFTHATGTRVTDHLFGHRN